MRHNKRGAEGNHPSGKQRSQLLDRTKSVRHRCNSTEKSSVLIHSSVAAAAAFFLCRSRRNRLCRRPKHASAPFGSGLGKFIQGRRHRRRHRSARVQEPVAHHRGGRKANTKSTTDDRKATTRKLASITRRQRNWQVALLPPSSKMRSSYSPTANSDGTDLRERGARTIATISKALAQRL